ncbi:MAG: hypothetical protein AAF602_04885 [Myxococcota bacterium]
MSRRRDPGATGLVAGLGLLFVGRGYLNGDIAAYCAQAWAGDLTDRSVHLGYIAGAAALAPLAGSALPGVLDLANVLAAGLAAVAVTRLTPAAPWTAGLATIGILLPWAPFAEVDVPWIALVLTAAAGAPGAAAGAVFLSPTALLALPWVALRRRGVGPLVEGALAVAVLTGLSGGDWWWGERGVLQPRSFLIGRNLGSWLATVPWLVVLTGRPGRWRDLVGLGPLLLAPADVPAPALVAIAVVSTTQGRTRGSLHRVARSVAIAAVLATGLLQASLRAARVTHEHAAILEVLRSFEPGDGLVAPFTWGARASVIATGDPYGLPWHPEGRFLRDQEARWAEVDGTIRVLPPQASATPPHDPGAPRP